MQALDTAAVEEVSVLHAEPDPGTQTAVERSLQRTLDTVTTVPVEDRQRAVAYVAADEVECVVSEYQCGSFDGLELLRSVRSRDEEIPFLFFSDVHDDEAATDALEAGADGFLYKTDENNRYGRLARRIESMVESRRRRDSLAETVRDFSRLFDQTDDVFWMYTADWEDVVFINSAYEDVWGQSLSRLESDPRAFVEATHPDDREQVITAMKRLSDGSSVDLEFRVNPDESFERWVWVQGTPITDSSGAVEYLAGYVRDVTDRREQQRELERRTEQLERRTEQREFFNSVLRHDVLNGMNVIRGRSEYLVDALQDEPEREQAETIRKWAEEINEVIEHVRSILQTIGTQGKQDLEAVDLEPLVTTEAERVAAASPDTSVDVEVPPGLTVRANDLLSTVISNLLTNAVEHNDSDGLTLRVTAEADGDTVLLRVADTGEGIPDDRKDAVFDRGESTRNGTERGGLGLYMVQTLVTTYGGEVWIEDNDPTGTVVCMVLPAGGDASAV
jgi:PAS domain S-box-containing protein